MHDETPSAKAKYCRIDTELLSTPAPESTDVTSWRIFRIMAEFVTGFELLRKYGLAATIFGSARATPTSPVYREAEKLGAMLSKAGFAIITGGGGGVMQGANKGAYEAGGPSVGLNIKLPMEQKLNQFVTESESFHFFFSRKVALAFASEVYIFFPGGFGTLDELFEIITLVQTKKIAEIPIILVDKTYWTPMLSWIEETVHNEYGAISIDDMRLYHLVDNADEAYELVQKLIPKPTS